MDFQEFLRNLLDALIEDDEAALEELHEVAWEHLRSGVQTFPEAGIANHAKGVIVKQKNSVGEYRLSIHEMAW